MHKRDIKGSTTHEQTLGVGKTFRGFCSQAVKQSQAATKPQMNSDSLAGLNCSGTVSLLRQNIQQTENHTTNAHGYISRVRFTLIVSLYFAQAALSRTTVFCS